jgi:hypothetical protein
MPHRSGRLTALIGAAALTLAIAAPASAADTDAMVRVLHASPDAPAVDVKVDDAVVLTAVPFKAISDYLAVPGGTYEIKVCATGTDTCVIDADLTFEAGKHYTVAATNVLASIEAQVLVDAPAPTADKTQVRVVHFSADTPAVDVLTQDGSAKVVEGLEYPDATDYLSLDPGSYDLKVCAAPDDTACPLDPGALDLAAGTAYSVFAVGSLAGETLDAVVAVDATYSAPAPSATPTAPPTDTVAGEPAPASTGNGILVAFGIVSLAAAASIALAFRLSARRIER